MAISQIVSDSIAANTVSSSLIANGSILSAHVANGAITSAHITSVANTAITGNIISSQLVSSAQYMGFKNRIINGGMTIDQRNVGASVATTVVDIRTYTLDRWAYWNSTASKFTVQQNAGSVTPPAGFTNYLGCTSTSAYSLTSGNYFMVSQMIEGLNVADLSWGTANAKAVTLSFWVRSSLTGTFGGALVNGASDRSYPFTYTINSANTWEYETITIPGDTTGTWLTTNGIGIQLRMSLGSGSTYATTSGAWAAGNYLAPTGATSVVGTNAATWYITGVQLELGSQATSFDYREYTNEMNICKRYFQKSYKQTEKPGTAQGDIRSGMCYHNSSSISGQAFGPTIMLPVTMRTDGTVTVYDSAGTSGKVSALASSTAMTNGISYNDLGTSDTRFYIRCYDIPYYGFGFHYTLSAEL